MSQERTELSQQPAQSPDDVSFPAYLEDVKITLEVLSDVFTGKGEIVLQKQPTPRAEDTEEDATPETLDEALDLLKPKVILQQRFLQVTNGATHRNYEESRKPSWVKEEIREIIKKKVGSEPVVVGDELFHTLSPEPAITLATAEETSATVDTPTNPEPIQELPISQGAPEDQVLTQQSPVEYHPPKFGQAIPADQFFAQLENDDGIDLGILEEELGSEDDDRIDPRILVRQILAEEQNMVAPTLSTAPHLLEFAKPPKNPHAPRTIIEDDLSDTSDPK